MTDGIVFVLHGEADQAYAAELAAALAPAAALPARLAEPGARAVRFGSAGRCVLVWSRDLAAQGPAVVLDALGHAHAVICRLDGAPLPDALARFAVATCSGKPAADVEAVRGALARLDSALAAREAETAQPALSGAGAAAPKNKHQLALRSATGIAATFAVVGMVAPSIAERAQALDAEPAAPAPTPAAQAESFALAEPIAHVAAPASVTPLVDEWLTAAPETQTAAPARLAVTAEARVEPIAAQALQPSPAQPILIEPIDPKRAVWNVEPDRSAKARHPDGAPGKGG